MRNLKLIPAWIMVEVLITKNVSATSSKAMNIKNYIAVNRVPLIVSVALAMAAGCVSMYISWQHNPQFEIHCEGTAYWGYWLSLGASPFVPVFLAVNGFAWVYSYVKNT